MIAIQVGIGGLIGWVLGNRFKKWAIHHIWVMYGLKAEAYYWNYPYLECIYAFCGVCIVWKYSWGWQCVLALCLTGGLIILSFIDFEHLLLPNQIIWFLWGLGIIASFFSLWVPWYSAWVGTIFAYLGLYVFSETYYQITGRVGLGQGDVKLMGVLGIWFGWESLLNIILVACFSGLICGVLLIFYNRKHSYYAPIPFGPFLALGGWWSLLRHSIN